MRPVAEVVKQYLVPGSLLFLLLGLAVGVGLLYLGDRARRWGRRWLVALTVLYWLLSMPLVADLLVGGLADRHAALTDPARAQGVTTVVVLSNGTDTYRANGQEVTELGKNTAYNALEGARLYRLLAPQVIVASGGQSDLRITEAQALSDALVRLGVPADRIMIEERSTTTREQAIQVAALLGSRGIDRFVLVTAPDHMTRALQAFRAQGLDPIASVSQFSTSREGGERWLERITPSRNALVQSDWAVYEYLARAYYSIRGWQR